MQNSYGFATKASAVFSILYWILALHIRSASSRNYNENENGRAPKSYGSNDDNVQGYGKFSEENFTALTNGSTLRFKLVSRSAEKCKK